MTDQLAGRVWAPYGSQITIGNNLTNAVRAIGRTRESILGWCNIEETFVASTVIYIYVLNSGYMIRDHCQRGFSIQEKWNALKSGSSITDI